MQSAKLIGLGFSPNAFWVSSGVSIYVQVRKPPIVLAACKCRVRGANVVCTLWDDEEILSPICFSLFFVFDEYLSC